MDQKFQFYDSKNKVWHPLPKTSNFESSLSLGEIIIQSFLNYSQDTAQICVDDGSHKTFYDIFKESVTVAENLKKIGIAMGDVVCISSKNNPDIASVFFGCVFVGASISTLDSSLRKDDLSHMLSIVKPKLVVCERSNYEYIKAALKENSCHSPILVFGDSVKNILFQPVEVSCEDFVPVTIPNQLTHVPMIICSSGSTGPPKGVCMSHKQLINFFVNTTQIKGVSFVFSSLHWASGVGALISGTTMGTTRLISERQFSAEFAVEIFQQYKVTRLFLLPLQMAAILECPKTKNTDFTSIKSVRSGGSFVAEELRANFEKLLPNGIVRVGYGMTEIGRVAVCLEKFKPSAVGHPVAASKIKIVDESGVNLGPNEVGEILIKSPCPFIGYMGNPEATKHAFDSDGWYRSGDLGYFDDDSYLFITGRCKEIIKYKNFHISPSELEDFLQKETGIMQVCVFGIDDFMHGTDLPAAAFVKPQSCTLTVENIQKIAKEKLPDYKQLRGGIYFLDKFPLTSSGKVKRQAVKAIFQTN